MKDMAGNNISRYSEYEKFVLFDMQDCIGYNLFGRLLAENGLRLLSPFYEEMIGSLSIGDYVYSCSVDRGGIVEEIIKDSDGFPLCVMVKSDRDTRERYGSARDHISVERISYWDKWKQRKERYSKDDLWDDVYFSALEKEIEAMSERGDLL